MILLLFWRYTPADPVTAMYSVLAETGYLTAVDDTRYLTVVEDE